MCFSTQLEDSRVIILLSQTIADEGEEIGQQVMALTDEDGFVPGQIYYRAMPERRNKDGEFITGWVEYLLRFSVDLHFRVYLLFLADCTAAH